MADESRWRDEERARWNAWRDERDHGRYERESGGAYGSSYRGSGYYGRSGSCGNAGRERGVSHVQNNLRVSSLGSTADGIGNSGTRASDRRDNSLSGRSAH